MTGSPAGGAEAPETPEAPRQPEPTAVPEARPGVPGTSATPATTPTPAPQPTPAPDTRPRPAFGEYAPEGWEWKPEEDAAATASPQANRVGGSSAGSTSSVPASVQGVPHNLGAGTARPARRGAAKSGTSKSGTPKSTSGAPYRGDTPGQSAAPRQAAQYRAPAGAAAAYGQNPPNMADRIITILLLVFGGFSALYSAFALMGLSTMFVVLQDAPGIDELTPPAWVDVTGKVAGIALLVLYGLVLVFSIRRLRARKLTFWAPLAAGFLAMIVVFSIVAAAMVGTPELMAVISDPDSSAQLLDYLQRGPTP